MVGGVLGGGGWGVSGVLGLLGFQGFGGVWGFGGIWTSGDSTAEFWFLGGGGDAGVWELEPAK